MGEVVRWQRRFRRVAFLLALSGLAAAAQVRQVMSNGDVYTGDLVDGLKSGSGEYVWADGHRYVGDYQERPHARQRCLHLAGRARVRPVSSSTGCAKARARCVCLNGDVYEGDFVANAMAGDGRLTFANGDVYEGDFVAGERTGVGVYLWQTGSRYEGQVRAGRPHGEGEYTRPDGWTYRGELRRRQAPRPRGSDLAQRESLHRRLRRDERNGLGYLYWRDGTLFRGHFSSGRPHGAGIKETPEGESFFEIWVEESLISSRSIQERPRCRMEHNGRPWMFDGTDCINGLAHGTGDAVQIDGSAWVEDADVVLGRLVDGDVVSLTLAADGSRVVEGIDQRASGGGAAATSRAPDG